MPKNIVLCLDGTNNEPEHGITNVTRFFQVARKDEGQVAYYDPGVGTMGARSATTRFGKWLTRVGGSRLVTGSARTSRRRMAFSCKPMSRAIGSTSSVSRGVHIRAPRSSGCCAPLGCFDPAPRI
jgi:hypothetical protein